MNQTSPLKSHTFLAFLTVLATYFSAVLAQHFHGLAIPPEMITGVAITAVGYIFARQWKSAKAQSVIAALKEADAQADNNPLVTVAGEMIDAAIQKHIDAAHAQPAPNIPAAVKAVVPALLAMVLLGGCASFGVWKSDANSQAIKTIIYTCENVSPGDTAAQVAEAVLATALEDAVSGAEGGVVGAVSKVLSDQGVKAYCMATKLLALWEHGAATPVAPTAIQSMPSALKASRLRSALSTLGVQLPK